MKRRHEMPFGAQCNGDGSIRFRLWAPAASRVSLSLEHTSAQIPLNKTEGGWFELVTDQAKAGDRYYFLIDDGQKVPDPASRFQPRDVHGPSEVVAAAAFEWSDESWQGRPWPQAVVYELHVGTFTPEGTFASAAKRLDYLAELGITAIELMPLSDFPGQRNWGYDGVFPFAPDSSYGSPDDLKSFIQSAHERGIMVLLDVVYNHFGPEGNYLGLYAPQFFTDRHHTPWGKGLNFDGPESRAVRDFFIHNALYWISEYDFDGLRLDAVHAIADDSDPHFLEELAQAVHKAAEPGRHVHLILENEENQACYLKPGPTGAPEYFTAQWNDDIHHALHVLITGEIDGYYSDYANSPLHQLGRCLTEGFAFQGEASPYRKGETRGESAAGLPLTAFVSFLQNHDQIGNRAFGERIATLAPPRAVRAAMATLLLAPSPPMLFMGEEFGAETPFLFFCDFEKDLARAVTDGRRNEFARFARFNDPTQRERIPDPNAVTTFESSRLDWAKFDQPKHQEWLSFYRTLLDLRRKQITPHLSGIEGLNADYKILSERVLTAHWKFPDQSHLYLLANLGEATVKVNFPVGRTVYTSDEGKDEAHGDNLPPWSVVWVLNS